MAATPKRKTTRSIAVRSHRQARELLASRVNLEKMRPDRVRRTPLDLDRVRAALTAMGQPHRRMPCVQVVGTNGKGAVCAMLDATLQASGYAVGRFTSPHLLDLRERMRVNGEPISEEAFVEALNRVVRAEANALGKDHALTYFELLTLTALAWFEEQAVDVALLEAGLGGRLDATSAVDPALVCVTAISLDHMHLLGDTLEAIAREKAGAFRAGAPVISVPQEKEVRLALKETAEAVGAPIAFLGRDIEYSQRFEVSQRLGPHCAVCLTTRRSSFEHVACPFLGEHQAVNCGLALAAWDRLREMGFRLDEQEAIAGLARAQLEGRMELVSTAPRILLDGAHNVAAMRALVRALGAFVPYDSLVMVFGCCDDKDVEGLLREAALGADKMIFTRARSTPRAVDPEQLRRRYAEQHGRMAQCAETVEEALELARRAVGRDDLVCVAGSFYLVGEARRALQSQAVQTA